MSDFGTRLRQIRRERGVGLRTLEQYVGAARPQLSRIENAKQHTTPAILLLTAYSLKLANAELAELAAMSGTAEIIDRLIEAGAYYARGTQEEAAGDDPEPH